MVQARVEYMKRRWKWRHGENKGREGNTSLGHSTLLVLLCWSLEGKKIVFFFFFFFFFLNGPVLKGIG